MKNESPVRGSSKKPREERDMRLKIMRVVLVVTAVLFLSSGGAWAQGPTTLTGMLPDGATYVIQVPPNWNGTLFLYSHGYVVPGSSNPPMDAGDPATGGFMLANGFALAGSSYATTGWAIEQALPDQIAVLDTFKRMVGTPKQTIAWGHSLGGMITAGLIQRYPDRFEAALPMCGVLSGGVATWNTALDSAFAFKTLLGPGGPPPLELVNITDPSVNLGVAESILAMAQTTPQGRAKLALVSALGDTPGWFDPFSPEPAANDFASQQLNQSLWASQVDFPFIFALRAELEFRAGGNVSWNTGVNYRRQLERSADRDEVVALYEQAGLSLDADLDTLEDTVRIEPDRHAIEYLEKNITYDGEIHIPVLTLHTTGDGLVVVQNESAYKSVVDEAGNGRLLRRAFVSRAGHCAFTPAETIAAVQTLLTRLETGKWPDVDASNLNTASAALGPLNTLGGGSVIPSAFVNFKPSRYLRPFNGEAEECESGDRCRDH
jgi:pimeloyl-ACP methyl ester carboxylesterase